jgi:hypothetical protein
LRFDPASNLEVGALVGMITRTRLITTTRSTSRRSF